MSPFVEPYIGLGSMDGRDDNAVDAARQAHQVLARAGIQAEIPQDLPAALWGKFLFVSAWGALGALTRAPIGMIRELPQTRSLLHRAMTEVHNLALAQNIKLEPDLVERCMDFVDAMEAHSTTSLQRDIIEGRPSELEAWSGAVVRLGRRAGVPTPVHEFAHSVLLLQEQAAGRA